MSESTGVLVDKSYNNVHRSIMYGLKQYSINMSLTYNNEVSEIFFCFNQFSLHFIIIFFFSFFCSKKHVNNRIDQNNVFCRGIQEKGSGDVVSAICYTVYTIYLSLCTQTVETTFSELFHDFPCICKVGIFS